LGQHRLAQIYCFPDQHLLQSYVRNPLRWNVLSPSPNIECPYTQDGLSPYRTRVWYSGQSWWGFQLLFNYTPMSPCLAFHWNCFAPPLQITPYMKRPAARLEANDTCKLGGYTACFGATTRLCNSMAGFSSSVHSPGSSTITPQLHLAFTTWCQANHT
jgi:hypothetical protein